MTHDDVADRALRWRCRRGMRELDAMLDRYLKAGYDTSERALLERLLAAEDDQLWDWLSGRVEPDDREVRELVEKIRTIR